MKYWGTNNTLANISLNLAPERSGAWGDKYYFFAGGGGADFNAKMIGYLMAWKCVNSFDRHGSIIIG